MTKRRKSETDDTPAAILLADARYPLHKIYANPNARERQEDLREREVATDELLRRYGEAEKAGRLDRLDIGVRRFCQLLKDRNGGQLPKRKGGRPANLERRILVCMAAMEKIETLGKAQGAIIAALHEVAAEHGCSYEMVRAAFYDHDPEWLLAVSASRAFHVPPEPTDQGVSDPPSEKPQA